MKKIKFRLLFFITAFLLTFLFNLISQAQENDYKHCNDNGLYEMNFGSFDTAISFFNEAIKLNPNYSEAYYNRGIAISKKNEFDKSQKDLDKALNDFNKAIELNPNYSDAYRGRGNVYFIKREYDKSLIELDKAIKVNPDNSNAYNARAYFYLFKGEADKAINDCNESIAIVPNDVAYFYRGEANFIKEEFDKALKDYNSVLRINSFGSADVYLGRGNTYLQKKDFYNAINDYNKYIDSAITINSNVYINRGIAYSKLREFDKAINDYNKAVEIDPKSSEAYCCRAQLYYENGSNENALKDYNKAIEIEPKNPATYNSRCYYYLNKGELDKAFSDINKALEIDPNSGFYYDSRADVYVKNGNIKTALEDYSKALEINPKLSESYIKRADIFYNKGDLKNALFDYNKAIDINPNNSTVEALIKKIQEKFSSLEVSLILSSASKLNNSCKRFALIIGNSNYSMGNTLCNTISDARTMETALTKCGFSIARVEDLDKKNFKEVIREFVSKIDTGSVTLFFYAGHGVQYNGENYLVPIKNDIKNEHEIEEECINLTWIIDEFDKIKPKTKILILDACRNNPFGKSFNRSISRGLAIINPSQDTLIAYSTSPGKVASDGDGDINSPYTEALTRNIQKPGIEISKVFTLTRKDVIAKTSNLQVPWENTSLVDEFYFIEK